jgi:hypothetical protein
VQQRLQARQQAAGPLATAGMPATIQARKSSDSRNNKDAKFINNCKKMTNNSFRPKMLIIPLY